MEKDPVLEKYENEGFGKNAFGWYFNPWTDEYDENYDPHNDKEYNEKLNEKEIKWHPKLTKEQIEELIAENIYPGDNEYDMYLWNHGIKSFEKDGEKPESVETEPEKTEPVEPEPKKTEPVEPEPERQEPVEPEPKKTEPVEQEPERQEPVEPEPKKTEPVEQEPEKQEPVESEPEKTEPKSGVKIIVKPETQEIICLYDEKDNNTSKSKDVYNISFNYNKESLDRYYEKIKDKLGEDREHILEAIDPNISNFVIFNGEKYNIKMSDYISALEGKNSNFKIVYDFKNVKKSGLNKQQIKNMKSIATMGEKHSNGLIEVEKRNNIFKRAFNNFKNRLQNAKRKKLISSEQEIDPKKQPKIMYKPKPKTMYKPKPKILYKPKFKNGNRVTYKSKTNLISKIKSNAVNIGKETVGGVLIAGTSLLGNLRGENKLVTENKKRSLRDKYFTGNIDHVKANENLKASEAPTQLDEQTK